ncbi:pyrroline-5-carboxylate reductase [Parabacteroides sp. PFB2-10]|uniref:pyrroline-5-carboxylate reductase n=1 Tax=Parabacteroides sp. PFB2-10 TaxID=1742405 RepID=UPI0024764A65|nr:pyrroline-5-carboxylate reductase [Parabacteroides sp. PFB2-10]MDH6311374.1 pyrroline-5-carboxylate reductase [Parabacteroides sp. PFB2-10]MDL2245206.1 pyrroline-5-carboxylate reductase [Parabacteroides sp. OttesenSCG-928-J18]
MKIAIIGTGNIGGAIARGLVNGTIINPSDVTCTAHPEYDSLDRLKEIHPDIHATYDNLEAVSQSDIIIISVKPWRVESVIDEIKPVLDFDRHMILSVAAGITFDLLNSYLTKNMDSKISPTIFRIMPNTAIAVMSSMTFVSARNASKEQTTQVLNIFKEMGDAMLIEERLMSAGTALASSGIAFAMRYIRASIEGGVELGFYPQEAQEIVLQTVKGAVDLLQRNRSNPEAEIDKVTTPGGITIKGLNEMELSGFTSSVIRGLKASK